MPAIPRVWHRAGRGQFRRRLQAGDLSQGRRPSGRTGPDGAAYCTVAQDCGGADCFSSATSATSANWRRAKAQDLRHEAIGGAGRANGWVASNVVLSLSTAAGSLLITTASLGVIAAAPTRGRAGAATNAAQRWRQQGGNRQRP